MSVFSLEFAVFALAVLLLFHALPRARRSTLLLAASYGFYATWEPHLPLLLAAFTVGNWSVARYVRGSRRWFWMAIAANVSAVALLRHAPALGGGILVGVSFYVMQAISYLADVRSGAQVPVGLRDLALYLAWFPRLLIGPIERASIFLPRLARPRPVDGAAIALSLTQIVEGLFRKVVLAGSLALLVPANLYAAPSRLSPGVLAAGLVASTFILYNEFAGYTSFVRGVSGLFGIELSPNFLQPQFSRSFTEFWTRWHLSLSLWLRDYVYLPLARALLRRDLRSRNVMALVAPPMAAMLVSGFWHGGTSGMLVWGALHGIFLSVERFFGVVVRPDPRRHRPAWRQVAQMLVVFVLGTLALVPFRTTFGTAIEAWATLCRLDGWSAPDPSLVLLVGLTLGLDALEYREGDVATFLRWPVVARAAALAAAVVLIVLQARGGGPPIVYQGF